MASDPALHPAIHLIAAALGGLLFACSNSAAPTPPRPATATTATATPTTAATSPSTESAANGSGSPAGTWEHDKSQGHWVRAGGKTEPLVVRGSVDPHAVVDDFGQCPEMIGGRRGNTKPLMLNLEGEPRTIHVFARARGPIGIASTHGHVCASAGPNAWAKLDLADASGIVQIDVADIDFATERRGQTSPYVLVVSDDATPPALELEPRAKVASTDAVVRWSIAPTPCKAPLDMYKYRCMRAGIEIAGAVTKSIALKEPLVGQLDCWPSGTGALCGGPSGTTTIALDAAQNGTVKVVATSVSDGYCPPPEDCSTKTTLATFKVPPRTKLVPDPAGSWPPRAP